MSSNLADLPLDLPADVSPYSHLVAKNGNLQVSIVHGWHISRCTNWKIYLQYWHLVVRWSLSFLRTPEIPTSKLSGVLNILAKVKMSSNLPDLPLDFLADLSLWYWHLVVKMSSNLADLPLVCWLYPLDSKHGQDEFKAWQIYPHFHSYSSKIPTSKFSEELNTMAKVWKL